MKLYQLPKKPINYKLNSLTSLPERRKALRTKILFAGLLFAVFFLVSLGYADVPQMINYQGKLTTAGGGCLGDTTISMTFKIYADSTAPTSLWNETQSSIEVEDGIFNVLLGSMTPIPDSVFDGSTRYLGVKVGTDNEMSPRRPLVSAGYAFRSEFSDTAEYARTGATDNDWVIRGDTIYHLQGNVGIGTTTPNAQLRVSTTGAQTFAVWGESVPGSGAGYGGTFKGGYIGVHGSVDVPGNTLRYAVYGLTTEGSGTSYGVHGWADGSGTKYGIYGKATGSGTNYGVYGSGSGGATNWAGYFQGNVNVTGNLSKGGGSFKIDHPLDPANKYLCHSFVESPDMMNVYNGNVILDANGEAKVQLPNYFEALNKDFRYQLTPVGVPGPNLYVAEEISGNSFKIAGGKAGMKVSWQVTGIRKDPFAEANRIQVELDKPNKERGKYLHPEIYGLGEEYGIHYDEHKRMMEEQLQEEKSQKMEHR